MVYYSEIASMYGFHIRHKDEICIPSFYQSNLVKFINFLSFMRAYRNAWLLLQRDRTATVLSTLDSRCLDSVCVKCHTADRLPVVSQPGEHEGFLTRNILARRTSL